MSARTVIQTDAAPGAIGPYNQAIVAAGLVFAAGQVGLDPATRELREGVEAQAEQAVANLRTAAVFAELRSSEWSAAPSRTLEPGRNDLLAAARRLRPEIDDLVGLMLAAGADPHLSGSGPTLFALTDDPERARSIGEHLGVRGVRAIVTRLRDAAARIEAIEEEEG